MKRQYDVNHVGVSSPRPVITENGVELTPRQVADRLNALQAAVERAHGIFLHAIDEQQTPQALTRAHGGPGLGYFEDAI